MQMFTLVKKNLLAIKAIKEIKEIKEILNINIFKYNNFNFII
jgi:hypothetical protein